MALICGQRLASGSKMHLLEKDSPVNSVVMASRVKEPAPEIKAGQLGED